jgi:hypothetical protein
LRESFTLDAIPSQAFGVITCDNEYRLWINDRLIAQDKAWESLESFDAIAALRVGQNVILVEAINGGNGPNPAALYFEMKLIDPRGTVSIASSNRWKYTASALDAQGKLAEGVNDWKEAVVADGPWGAD